MVDDNKCEQIPQTCVEGWKGAISRDPKLATCQNTLARELFMS